MKDEPNIPCPTRQAPMTSCLTCGYSWTTGTNGTHSCADNLLKKIERLEANWVKETRIIELLVVGGFVKREKVEEARQLLSGVE